MRCPPFIALARRYKRLLPGISHLHFLCPPRPASQMPAATRPFSTAMSPSYLDLNAKDNLILSFNDNPNAHSSNDNDQMMFPLDFEDSTMDSTASPLPWESPYDPPKPNFMFPTSPHTYDLAPSSPHSAFYASGEPFVHDDLSPTLDNGIYLGNWVNDPEFSLAASPVSPLAIPSSLDTSHSGSFIPYNESHFPPSLALSPASYAALHPLPRSMSPTSPIEEFQRQRVDSISPQDVSGVTPSWASHLWDTPSSLRSPSGARHSIRHSPLCDTTVRQKVPTRRGSVTSQAFLSASAPSAPTLTRSYSRRAESVSVSDDRDATVRKKKRSPVAEDHGSIEKERSDAPLKPVLKPPKLAPSAWQLYFTDWIQKQQSSGTRKLNVAQAAKEAGQEYANLSPEEKEPYKRRSQAMKEARERELNAYMRSLTPEDIKRENAFRAAQRKAGKSRKGNIKDPNAPKKPLSAYFMFLQRIRANPRLVREVFGDETETTKQSVLAAAKWRSMTDAERQPFLAQAEQEKMEYEAARKMYEEGTTGPISSINFSILPSSPALFPKLEFESDSEDFSTDDGVNRPNRS
ncbi:hypothetical protein M378DRAFT_156363 [Amanita muscaria Koide BX008]|uniref:HMG box domain-containing protein n=1 Tax=Amanita muscaria (strain Koide BX008) TaxID=946122 RepID=A0A0C2X7F2_AMAMK|nr:hypothetical protein M378DRAFT_156363 [Amanita muscaria Koide BX008]